MLDYFQIFLASISFFSPFMKAEDICGNSEKKFQVRSDTHLISYNIIKRPQPWVHSVVLNFLIRGCSNIFLSLLMREGLSQYINGGRGWLLM